jgi:uncharacterized iron-regulated membrane protein
MALGTLRYWAPRIAVLAFAVSLILPAPKFIRQMGEGDLFLWLARLIWILGLMAVFAMMGLVGSAWKKRRER